VFSNRQIATIGVVLSWTLLLAGCAQTRVATPVPSRNHIESVAFTSTASRVDIIDQATSTLVSSNFSITLANDRIGLVQSDFVSISTVEQALADTLDFISDHDNLLMRVAVNAEERDETVFVSVKGTFQRVSGASRSTDNLIGLYWLEQLAEEMATGVDAQFTHQLSDSTYVQILGESSLAVEEPKSPGLGGAVKAGGIILAILFVVQLASGAFGAGPGETAPAQ